MSEIIVAFVILHYNTIDVTINCVVSIMKLNGKHQSRIVIIDNASPNDTGKILAKKYQGDAMIDVLLRESNDGFSVGNNEGCAYAIKKWNPDFLVVANNDIEFCQNDFLIKIFEEYRRNPFAILGPDIYEPIQGVHQSPIRQNPPDKKEVNRTIILNQLMIWIYPLVYPIMKHYFHRMDMGVQAEKYNTYQENVCLMGACMIYSREYMEVRDRIFEPETKFYYEEFIQTLWCLRNKKKIVYNPDIMVHHMEGKATHTIDGREKERIRFRMNNILHAARVYRRFCQMQ